jgi:hypothetical protein
LTALATLALAPPIAPLAAVLPLAAPRWRPVPSVLGLHACPHTKAA